MINSAGMECGVGDNVTAADSLQGDCVKKCLKKKANTKFSPHCRHSSQFLIT